MKLARYLYRGEIAIGVAHADVITPISGRVGALGGEMIPLIAGWDDYRPAVAALDRGADIPLAGVALLAPIARPGRIWGIGLNYADHIEEAGLERPAHQSWFVKGQSHATGPYQPIELPKASKALDYEAELVLVVGRGGRHLSGGQAKQAIFGYCIGNDVSVRDWQFQSGQFSIGKSFESHAPFGPWIVTADEIDPGNLAIRGFVNGEQRQNSNTRYLIYDPVAQIEHLSQVLTLHPGDVIYTGTPAGVGVAMKPPRFLTAGDVVRVEIDGIGHIENQVVNED